MYIQICQTNQFFASYYNQEASRGESDGQGHSHGRDGYSETETMQILSRTHLQSASSNSNEMQRHMYFTRAGETQMQHNFTPHISPPNYQVGRLIKAHCTIWCISIKGVVFLSSICSYMCHFRFSTQAAAATEAELEAIFH